MAGESARSRSVPTDATATKAREILARHDLQSQTMSSEASVQLICRDENVGRSTVWNWISLARGGPTVVGAEPVQRPARQSNPRMSERAALYRAWITLHLDARFGRFDERVRLFWLKIVLAVHKTGDGFGLNFEECGFDDRDDFAESHGGDGKVLDALIRRKLLEGTPQSVSLPAALGLTKGERVGGKLVPGAPSSPSDTRQGSLPPMGLPTRRELDSGWTPPESNTPESNRIDFDSDRTPAPLPAGLQLAGSEGTKTTKTKREESLSLVGGQNPAGEAGNPPESSPADRTPAAGLGRHVTLAAEIMTITGRPGLATPNDLNAVRACLESGGTPDGLREFAIARMSRERFQKDPPTVSYLARGYLGVTQNPPPAAPPPPQPAEPEAPEDPAQTVDWLRDDPDHTALLAAWTPMRGTLKEKFTPAEWHTWLRPMVLRGLDGHEIVIALPSGFIRDRVVQDYGKLIEGLWLKAYPEAHSINFKVHGDAK